MKRAMKRSAESVNLQSPTMDKKRRRVEESELHRMRISRKESIRAKGPELAKLRMKRLMGHDVGKVAKRNTGKSKNSPDRELKGRTEDDRDRNERSQLTQTHEEQDEGRYPC